MDAVFSMLTLCSWVMILTSQLLLSFLVFAPFSAFTFTFTTAQLFYHSRFAEPANPWLAVYLRPMRAFMMKADFGIIRGMLIDGWSQR
jgi:hypothetical protein